MMSVSERIKELTNEIVAEQDNIYLLNQLKEKNFEIDRLNRIIASRNKSIEIFKYTLKDKNIVIDQLQQTIIKQTTEIARFKNVKFNLVLGKK